MSETAIVQMLLRFCYHLKCEVMLPLNFTHLVFKHFKLKIIAHKKNRRDYMPCSSYVASCCMLLCQACCITDELFFGSDSHAIRAGCCVGCLHWCKHGWDLSWEEGWVCCNALGGWVSVRSLCLPLSLTGWRREAGPLPPKISNCWFFFQSYL